MGKEYLLVRMVEMTGLDLKLMKIEEDQQSLHKRSVCKGY